MSEKIEILRPSALQQYSACPGSYKMQLGFPPETSPEAEEGTMLHERVRRNDTDGLDVEQAGAVEECRQFLEDTIRDSGLATATFENPLEIHDEDGSLLTKGTADVLLTGKGDTCAVIDWKFGRVPVEDAATNLQLAAYALGAMQLIKAQSCTVHVFQPRIKKHTQYTFSKPEAILQNIQKVISRAKSDALILRAGEACRYCKAKAVCPAFRRQTDALAILRDNADALATPERLAEYYAKTQIVKKFCTQIEDAMKAYLDEHGECAGYFYKEIAGKREVSDIAGLCVAVDGLITHSEFLDCCTASTSKVEALFVEKLTAAATANGGNITKKDAKAKFEEVAAAFIQRGTPSRRIELKQAE